MKRKGILSIILLLGVCLTGCGSTSELSELNSIKSAKSTQYATQSKALSELDAERQTYERVTARKLLDISTLEKVNSDDKTRALNYLDTVDEGLTGQKDVHVRESEVSNYKELNPVNEDVINYILMMMEQTPYYWQRSQAVIRGKDTISHSIVVDVTYKTIGYEKEVKHDSYIALGSKNYDKLIKVRYQRYLNYLNAKYASGALDRASLQKLYQKWKSAYGDPKEVYESQRNLSMLQQIYESGNQITYKGLIDSDAEKSTGTMVVRYSLTPSYVLGVSTGITCNQAYLLSYNLDIDPTEGLTATTQDGYQTVTDNVYAMLHSYFTAIDESNHNGLYELTKNYASLDKSFQDQFDTSYQKHEGYTLTVFNVQNTEITCGVTASVKQRAKGTDMTMPLYDDRYLFTIVLDGDNLKVKNMVLISREIAGEPAINEGGTSKQDDFSGFTSEINLTNDDKKTIEGLIVDFSKLQLNRDTKSEEFSKIVDISIGQGDLSTLKTNMMSQKGEKKVVYLTNYMTGQNNYASVSCTEDFQSKTNQITEANVEYDFIKKGADWKVMAYSVNGSIKLDTTNLDTNGALAVLNKDKVLSYTSQVNGTSGAKEKGKSDASDISITVSYDEYVPKIKKGNKEKGLLQYTPGSLKDEDLSKAYNEYFTNSGSSDGLSWTEFNAYLKKNTSLDSWYKSCVAYELNVINSRYSDNATAKKKSAALVQQANGFSDSGDLDSNLVAQIGIISGKVSESTNSGSGD